jgi:peptide/nickel transport system permease protein
MLNTLYWKIVRKQFLRHKLAVFSLFLIFLYILVGIYAPFLASSKPFFVKYDGTWYFPLFRYLFYTGFYSKKIDIFFNLLIFTFPFFLMSLWRSSKNLLIATSIIQIVLFGYFSYKTPSDPGADPTLIHARQEAYQKLTTPPSWDFDLKYMSPYEKLNELVRYRLLKSQNNRILDFNIQNHLNTDLASTLWNQNQARYESKVKQLTEATDEHSKIALKALIAKHEWLETQSQTLEYMTMPLIRDFHWEDDAGGQQSLNKQIPWEELTRINRKDLAAALIFGVRVSLVVGILAVFLALIIGIPFGAAAGYYGGKFDIIVSRLLEIWESMPVFFMLLLVVVMTQSKSIFIVICVIGLFGWTTFARYIRGEFFKQRNLAYVEACRAQGFSNTYIIFTHILPNAIPPVLTLLPFSIMAAITSEAALSFLGLGEEGSASWGVLMDEGRSAFPGESYLLWPPAILLTVLLIAIALVGDALRDALDPKLQVH